MFMKPLRAAGAAIVLSVAAALPAQAERQIAATHFGALTYSMPLAIAQSQGYFADAGVQVDGILTSKGGATAIRNAMASDIKYGEVGLPALMAARRSGLDLVIVNVATASHGDAMWVAKKGSPYKSLKDLEGQTVTFTNPKSGSETNIRQIMSMSGVNMNLVASGGLREGLTMVATGDAAAAPIVEPIASLQADKFQRVFKVNDVLPRMVTIVGFAPRDYAEANADEIRRIIEARRRAVQLMYSDPAAAAKAVLEGGYRYPPQVVEKVIRDLTAENFWSEGTVLTAELEPNIDQLVTVGAIDNPEVDWSAVVDRGYLPQDLGQRK